MSLAVAPGDTVKLTIPISSNSAVGSFCSRDSVKSWLGADRNVTAGFIVEDDTVGSISPLKDGDESCAGVYYTQKTYGVNKVVYFGTMLEEFTFNIVNIPVHDHSSLAQGGPAHGTYYSESGVQQSEPDGGTA